LLTTLSGLVLALWINSIREGLGRIAETLFFLPVIISWAIASLLFYYLGKIELGPYRWLSHPSSVMMKNMRLVNTLTALIIPWGVNAFGIFLMRQFMLTIPKDLMDAARIDGAAESKILIKIVPPMVSSSIVATFILCFIYSWNEFLFALILSIKNTTTLTVGATLFITAWGVQWGEISAAIVISTIIPFVLTFYIQKHLIEAYSGGLKE